MEQNYSRRFSRFDPSRSSRTFYNGSLCVRFKNVPHDTQGWCIHLYTEQYDGERKRIGGEEARENTHEHCIHSRWQVGEFGLWIAQTKSDTSRSPSVKDRARDKERREREREQWRKRDRTSVAVGVGWWGREYRRGREKKREKQAKALRMSLFSSLLSLP